MLDGPITEGKEEKNLTIVLDNGIYLTCIILGVIITNCDFRNAANQRELGGGLPRGRTKLEGTPAVETLHNGKARKALTHRGAGLVSRTQWSRFRLGTTCSKRGSWKP